MIIEPEESNPASRIVDAFVDAGLSRADAEAFADLLGTDGLVPGLSGDSPDSDLLPALEVIAERLAKGLRDTSQRELALTREVSGLLGFGPMHPPWIEAATAQPTFEATIAVVIERARTRLGIDFERAINQGVLAKQEIKTPAFLSALLRHHAVRLERILDLPTIRASVGRKHWAANLSREEAASVLDRVFDAFHDQSFDLLLPVLAAEPDESVADLASGLLNRFSSWFIRHDGTAAEHDFSAKWTAIGPSFAGFAEHLHARWARRREDAALEQTFWRFGWRAYGHAPDECPASMRDDLVRTARDALGKLRQLMSQAEEHSESAIAERLWQIEDAALVLGLFGGMWALLRPLALALRGLRTPCVASDLRYWPESSLEEPPPPWRRIPELFAGAVHLLARKEQEHDHTLHDVRSKFARFLLERLTTRTEKAKPKDSEPAVASRTEPGPKEPSAMWRLVSIRAALELHVNPEGRGHRILHHAAEHDPDPDVRKLARSAYGRLRASPKLPDSVSPRRALLAAFWWLRQAHLIELGMPIDAVGAQRTLRKEVRYTTRADD